MVVASNQAQETSLRADVEYLRDWGFDDDDIWWLSAEETRLRIAVAGALGAMYSPHCARVHPAKLVRGLARAVERLDVPIYERTPVLDRIPGGVRAQQGDVGAEIVVRATEGYTTDMPRLQRTLIPVYSLMIATEPLPDDVWAQIGWEGRECWNDGRHLLVYLSRTVDGRVAIGGRGAPYHFGSRIAEEFENEPAVFDALYEELCLLLPQVRGAAVTHRWGGPIGITRDWCSNVGFDRAGGSAWACGYVGDGVATSNLAGRTLRDLIRGEQTELTRLPWVGHQSRRWEPEPFRFVGVNLALKAMASGDKTEARTGKPAKRAAYMEKLIS
jgi:glycine/D-amino acid oxidase-like deaminating enzyme